MTEISNNTASNSFSEERVINILMTGAGAPGAAGILKCLYQYPSFNVLVADANENAVGRYINNDFIQIPKAGDPAFVDTLISICREKNIHVLLPLVTKELIPLAKNKTAFEAAGTKVLVSDAESLEIANDKGRLYTFLQWRGIEVPDFRIIDGALPICVQQFKQAIEDLGYPERPVCFKPVVSNGSRGFRVIDASVDEHDLLFNHKPNSTVISLADTLRILSQKPFPELLVSAFLPGDEYSVDCLADHGETILALPRWRKKMINGISVEGEFVNDENIINYCKQIIASLRLHGNIGIQVKKSAEGKFLVLEINPRVQGTISAALGAGINLPALAIRKELGLSISASELDVKWGTKFSRYWAEVFY